MEKEIKKVNEELSHSPNESFSKLRKKSVGRFVFIFASIALFAVFLNSWINDQCFERNSMALKYGPYLKNMWNPNDNLRTLKRVFDRLGHERVNSSDESCDVYWYHGFNLIEFLPFLKKLKPRQRFNHLPGIALITNKSILTTQNRFDFIPRAFQFPRMSLEFNNYTKLNPEKQFVVKSDANRGVKLVKFSDMNFKSYDNKFYQEFVENPLLIDDRAFDMGVYVLISSLDPLRVYRFKSDVLLRFCPLPYYPFDIKNRDKYVIADSYKTILEMPSLKNYFSKMGYSCKDSIEAHLRSRGFDIQQLWSQIDNAIVELLLSKEKALGAKSLPSLDNFFEFVRFDFIVDKNLKVYLMEINLSPNMTPRKKEFEFLSSSFEQVVYNAIQCSVGINFFQNLHLSSKEESSLLTVDHLLTDPETCISHNCSLNCKKEMCKLCSTCMNERELKIARRSYLEHIRRGEMLRLFPRSDHFDDKIIEKMSEANKFQAKWFKSKCGKDKDWC